MTEKIVVPADEWDTLELVAEAYGGIGRLQWIDELGRPCCLIGAAAFAGVPGYHGEMSHCAALTEHWHGVHFHDIDRAQRQVAGRSIEYPARVPFLDLMKELGAVRGDA